MNKSKIIGTVILVIVIPVLIYFNVFHTKIQNGPNRQALSVMMQNLSIDDSKEDFDKIYEKYKTDKLNLYKSEGNQWYVRMPIEFGATDWILLVDFKNDKITGIKIRISDDIIFHPKDAPEDKVKHLTTGSTQTRNKRGLVLV